MLTIMFQGRHFSGKALEQVDRGRFPQIRDLAGDAVFP
jgi:hypothetical protein